MRINSQKNYNQNFKSISKFSAPLGQFHNKNATLPTLIIESGVTLGRAYEANKRGGKPEMVDRLVEQGISAIVWVYGVNILKNIGNSIGKKVLKIKDFNFDIGFDELRNPLKYIDKKAVGFKASNLIISTAIATFFIGAVLPKINNFILKKMLNKNNQKLNEKDSKKTITFEEFKESTNKTNKKNIPFTSLIDKTIGLAHVLENNSTARLLITDTGVVAGRFHNAQNKYRKIEGLFRDISSIYFYLFSTKHIVNFLDNKVFKNANINPKALESTVEMLNQKVKEMSSEEFKNSVIGSIDSTKLAKLKDLFKERKTISVDEFISLFPEMGSKAKEMAKMQYIEQGNGILSFSQAKNVLSSSLSSDPSFIKKALKNATGKEIDDKLCYVSSKELDGIKNSIDNFINQIYLTAKKKNQAITPEFIKKLAKNNIGKNFLFNSIGTGISIFALGILIPKIQYWITKKLTNENKFHTEED